MTRTFEKRCDRDADGKRKKTSSDITPLGDSSISRYVNSIPSRIGTYKYGNETARNENHTYFIPQLVEAIKQSEKDLIKLQTI